MKSKIVLFLMMALFAVTQTVSAQPMASMEVPYRQVIFSEVHAAGASSYVEITNVGDSTVNLKEFNFFNSTEGSISVSEVVRDEEGNILNVYYTNLIGNQGPGGNDGRFWIHLPDQLLKPGESFLISEVHDRTYPTGVLIQREELVAKQPQMFIHAHEILNAWDTTIVKSNYPEYLNFDFDSVSTAGISTIYNSPRTVMSKRVSDRMMLHHRIYEDGVAVDSVLIDGVKHIFGDQFGPLQGSIFSPTIAGVEDALANHIIVRKSDVKYGNRNWDLSRGVSAEDSEWLLIPRFYNRKIWTSVGVHGNFSVSATSETANIDLNAQTITVPWGVYKTNNGDSLIQHHVDLGPGIAWNYADDGSNFESGGHTIAQTGDTLTLYATGDVLDIKELRVIVEQPAANETRVFPRRNLVYPEDPDDPLDTLRWGGMPYYVTKYNTIIDTIGNVGYATRVDSLFKYLEKAEKATWEIAWSDGVPRADLKKGDILRVTAENASDTRDYYIDVLDYEPSENANLASITWPDKPGFMMGWNVDTIPNFSPGQRNYTITIPYEIKGVPALQVTTQNPNAKVKMYPATSVSGMPEERTTRIEVTAADGKTVYNYRVTFAQQKPSELKQPWAAEPIFSEFLNQTPAGASHNAEIYNPGTEPIDLSNYMINYNGEGGATFAETVAGAVNLSENGWSGRYSIAYIPGYNWEYPYAQYQLNPGYQVFDPVVDPILEPGETFTLVSAGLNMGPDHWLVKRADVVFNSGYATHPSWSDAGPKWEAAGGSQWGTPMDSTLAQFKVGNVNRTIWISKILNDSIQRGLKPIRDAEDFEIIDQWGKNPDTHPFMIAGREAIRTHADEVSLRRKPNAILPNTEEQGGWGTTAEDSDWIVVKDNDVINGVQISGGDARAADFGYHNAIEATLHLSSILSKVYKVDDGYKGDLSIRGVSNGENVGAFLGNLIKRDPGQVLVVSATAGGEAKGQAAAVAEGDVLTVTSANGENQTVYTISLTPLDDNNTLTPSTALGGTDLVITREGDEGLISNFPFGRSLRVVFEDVVAPATASLSIINADGELLPLSVWNNDTVKVDAVASENVYFKVTAENGDVAMYRLQPSTSASDAYVLSDIYLVDQGPEFKAAGGAQASEGTIGAVLPGTDVSAFYANLKPVAGATMQVHDKNGMARTSGNLKFDDFLYVTSEDGSVTKVYQIEFILEPEGLNLAPRQLAPDPSNLVLVNVSEDGAEATLQWDYDFGMESGFVVMRDGVVADTVYTNSITDSGLVKSQTYQYSVYAFNEFGNSGDVSLTVVTNPTSAAVIDANEISVYPTVTRDRIHFLNLPSNSRVAVSDLTGRTLLVRNARNLESGLSLQNYTNGIYLIRIMEDNKFLKSVKIIKQ
jgi:hypothetical protein